MFISSYYNVFGAQRYCVYPASNKAFTEVKLLTCFDNRFELGFIPDKQGWPEVPHCTEILLRLWTCYQHPPYLARSFSSLLKLDLATCIWIFFFEVHELTSHFPLNSGITTLIFHSSGISSSSMMSWQIFVITKIPISSHAINISMQTFDNPTALPGFNRFHCWNHFGSLTSASKLNFI